MFLDKGLIDQIRYVAYVHGMAGNKADRWGLSHLEPPKSQPTLESKSGWCANMFLDKGFIDQIRCCLCARDGREPCRTMQNHADRWGLSHLEPTEAQAILAKSSQIGVPACFLDTGYTQIRLGMLPMRPGWQGTLQIGGDFRTLNLLNHLQILKSFQVAVPK